MEHTYHVCSGDINRNKSLTIPPIHHTLHSGVARFKLFRSFHNIEHFVRRLLYSISSICSIHSRQKHFRVFRLFFFFSCVIAFKRCTKGNDEIIRKTQRLEAARINMCSMYIILHMYVCMNLRATRWLRSVLQFLVLHELSKLSCNWVQESSIIYAVHWEYPGLAQL